jgi:intraflagellar transport protein 140
MAIFCPYKIPPWDESRGPVDVKSVAWSRDSPDNALLAVATDSAVHLFNDEGEPVGDPCYHPRGNLTPTCVAWSVNHPVLIIGWNSGHLSVCREDAVGSQQPGWCRQRESSDLHKHPICAIVFSPQGSRCVVSDTGGLVSVWKTVDGNMVAMCHYGKLGSHEHIAFRTMRGNVEITPDKDFFFVGEKGILYSGDDFGLCSERYRIQAPVQMMEYYHAKDMIVMITNTMILKTFSFDASFEVVNETRTKLSVVNPENFRGSWAGPGVLATLSGEALIRLWAIDDDEHYILPLEVGAADKAICLAYHPRKRTLAVGTREGRVQQWRATCAGAPTSETMWERLPSVDVTPNSNEPVQNIGWGPGERLLYSRCNAKVTVLSETQLCCAASTQWVAYQKASSLVGVQHLATGGIFVIEMSFRVKGAALHNNTLAVWSNRVVQSYNLTPQGVSVGPTFGPTTMNSTTCMGSGDEMFCFAANDMTIEQLTMSGMQRTYVTLSAAEGSPVLIDAVAGFLIVVTSTGMVKMFNVKGSTMKAVGTARRFEVNGVSPGEIRSVKLNCTGTCASLAVEKNTGQRSLFVFDVENDRFNEFEAPGQQLASHLWEVEDPRMLACELTAPLGNAEDESAQTDPEVVTLFVRPDNLVVQERLKKTTPGRMAAAVRVPHVYLALIGEENRLMDKRVLRDYVGLENSEPKVLKALRDFSYHIAAGNTDEAYRCVEGIRSKNIWENLAKMCVKTQRIDVAEKCLGQMKHLRAASALREARSLEPDAQLAVVATHLDLLEEAAELYTKCGRYDKLNLLYQSAGQWEKAIEVAQKHDRIHLHVTYFNYAKHLEGVGDIRGSMRHYELADAAQAEIPRVLNQHNLQGEVQQYVEQAGDRQMYKWLAQFLESKGEHEAAAAEYRKAEDHLSLCRLACFSQGMEAALQICMESGDSSACYHLARHLEADGRPKEAIELYSRSGRVGHALRLAQSHNLDNELMSLALGSGSANEMLRAGRYCEQSGQPQKAVTLYQKAGYTTRALELCFNAKLYDQLRKIAEDIRPDDSGFDPEILSRVAKFFLAQEQHDKAVHILGMSKQYEKAIDLCTEQDVQISEEMAEKMTPAKDEVSSELRTSVLLRIAKLCKKQGQFQLACKKYTQAGDKTKAMKTLLQSNDTEKIIFFAGTARQADVYVLAANYLQSMDWHNPEVMKNIILFYTKAKEFEKLGTFYEHCAQAEIDEYRDYEKAAGALAEAHKYLSKEVAGKPASDPARLEDISERIKYVEKFAGARKKEGPAMIAVLEELLENPDSERGVRVGDIFALMVEYHYSQADYVRAFECVERMRERQIVLDPYLDKKMVQEIYRQVGQPLEQEEHGSEGEGSFVEEEVEEDFDDDGRV